MFVRVVVTARAARGATNVMHNTITAAAKANTVAVGGIIIKYFLRCPYSRPAYKIIITWLGGWAK